MATVERVSEYVPSYRSDMRVKSHRELELEERLAALEAENNLRKALVERLCSELTTGALKAIDSANALSRLNEQLPLEVSHSISLGRHLHRIKSTLNDLSKMGENAALFDEMSAPEQTGGRKNKVGLTGFLENISFQDYNGQNNNKRVSVCLDNSGLVLDQPEALLKTLMDTLIYNALSYSNFSTEVKVDCKETDKEVMLIVKDAGVGIPVEDQEKIFEPFFRASNIELPKGLGVGLSIAKAVSEKLGGSLTFESKEGEGTVFCLTLPK